MSHPPMNEKQPNLNGVAWTLTAIIASAAIFLLMKAKYGSSTDPVTLIRYSAFLLIPFGLAIDFIRHSRKAE